MSRYPETVLEGAVGWQPRYSSPRPVVAGDARLGFLVDWLFGAATDENDVHKFRSLCEELNGSPDARVSASVNVNRFDGYGYHERVDAPAVVELTMEFFDDDFVLLPASAFVAFMDEHLDALRAGRDFTARCTVYDAPIEALMGDG